MPTRIAILASVDPTCLRRLAEDARAGRLAGGEIACVLSNHDDLERVARESGLKFAWKPAGDGDPAPHFDWLLRTLRENQVELVVLARYMRILPREIVHEFRQRIINVHPSLLPFFPGAAPYRQAFESGVRIHGCTAHFVTEQLDEGPIILQDVFDIDVGSDTLDDVRRKGLELEADVLSRAVRLFLDGKLRVVEGKVMHQSVA
jgi:formyltetrahydrofolate deformylase